LLHLKLQNVETRHTIVDTTPKNDNSAVHVAMDDYLGHNNEGFDAWIFGIVFSNPVYFGYRLGYGVTRGGFTSQWAHSRTQNTVHKYLLIGTWEIGRQHFYLNYEFEDYSKYSNIIRYSSGYLY
jgi:hypothetical protein